MKSTETILAEIQKDIKYNAEKQKKGFEDIKQHQENIIISQNGKNKMLDDRISKECLVIDKIDERLQSVEVKQAVVVTKLAMLISGAIFAVYFLIERAWEFIINL